MQIIVGATYKDDVHVIYTFSQQTLPNCITG